MERRADDLAQELGDRGVLRPPGERRTLRATRARTRLSSSDLERLAGADARGAGDRLADEAGRGRAGADPDRRGRSRSRRASPSRYWAAAQDDLVAEARLADAGRRGDQHRARDRLGDALVEYLLNLADFALAPDARDRPAKEGAERGVGLAFADELEATRVAADLEAAVEQAGGRVVDADRSIAVGRDRLGVGAEHRGGAIDRLADGPRRGDLAAAGRDRDAGVREVAPAIASAALRAACAAT